MSGTDASRAADWSPDGPAFVLVEPQLGENIGAAARAMWNFGLRGMRVVRPRDGWPNPKAVAMASGAGGLLDEAGLFETTEAAVADCARVYATTARPREMTKQVLTPEAAMVEARALTASGARVAVLFGGERAGLSNDDVGRAHSIVTAPVNPAFASLNLGQTVLLMAYEWRRAAGADLPPDFVQPDDTLAPHESVVRMIEHLVSELDTAGFFFPSGKRPSMVASLTNMLHRQVLTVQDVQTLRGIIRALAEGPRRHGPDLATITDMTAARAAIDATDKALMRLFGRRQKIIERVAHIKAEAGLPARIQDRVEQVVENARQSAVAEGLDPDLIGTFWRTLIEAAIATEEKTLKP